MTAAVMTTHYANASFLRSLAERLPRLLEDHTPQQVQLLRELAKAEFEKARFNDIGAIFDELEQLQDGWLDGSGKAPDKERLHRFAALMAAHFPDNIPLPAVVPTPEGNLLLEWQGRGAPSVDVELATMQAYFHAFDENGGDIERDFLLSDAKDAAAFFAFLSAHIQERQA